MLNNAGNAPGLIYADAPVTGISAADKPGYIMANPVDNFLGGAGSSIGNYLVGNLDAARDATALRNAFGVTAPIPSAGSPLGVWGISEETQAGYLKSEFEAKSFPLDGNIGLRVVQTVEAVTGSQSAPSSSTVLPININSTDMDYLPSTARCKLPGHLTHFESISYYKKLSYLFTVRCTCATNGR